MVYDWTEERPKFDSGVTDSMVPCSLCSEESFAVGSGYCREHFTEALTNAILNQYPVSGPELLNKMEKKRRQ
jgi:hypothetical protein